MTIQITEWKSVQTTKIKVHHLEGSSSITVHSAEGQEALTILAAGCWLLASGFVSNPWVGRFNSDWVPRCLCRRLAVGLLPDFRVTRSKRRMISLDLLFPFTFFSTLGCAFGRWDLGTTRCFLSAWHLTLTHLLHSKPSPEPVMWHLLVHICYMTRYIVCT